MKLTQKIIQAVHYEVTNKAKAEIKISPAELQDKVLATSFFTKEDFAVLVNLHKKYPGLVGLRTQTFVKGGTFATTHIGGIYTKVIMSDAGTLVYPAALGFGSLFVSDKVPTKNWSVVLSAFSTVEEAVATYPELKPAFEELFGVKL